MKQVLILAATLFAAASCNSKEVIETRYLASDRTSAYLYSVQNLKKPAPTISDSLARGTEFRTYMHEHFRLDKERYYKVKCGKRTFYAKESNLVSDPLAVVQEQAVFMRTPASVISDTTTSRICGLADKAQRMEVTGYDRIDANGVVNRYKVRCGGTEGYVYGKYTVYTQEEAQARYMPEKYDVHHAKITNQFGGGKAIGCDFFPVEKPSFASNKMPSACYSLYLNIGVVGSIDKYIELAKKTRINTFVIDIKDNECPGYRAEAMEKYSPTNFKRAGATREKLYAYAVKRLHEEGFYAVGRITCFKDTYFVKDHPECAITEKATGEPFLHNKAYWPSAYDRKIWQFNVELAKEAVRKFGFDEINFDYVRFPDRMTKIEGLIDYHNRYNESKVQAIQRFVTYACDEIHALGAYVSIDVFGECANPGYTTAYGQYWPALSNVADVMCGMPYPDHFSDGYYGISKPWNHPYELLKAWGERVQGQQAATTSPAKVRTWVQAYHVMRWVDKDGIDYNAENIAKEVRGLCAAGLKDGYTTWLAGSRLERYEELSDAFRIDYANE